jgi:hypothetical protein
MSNLLIEGPGGVYQIKQQGGYNSLLPIATTGLITGGSGQINGNLTVTGTLSAGAESVTSQTITASSANAFTVGANGTTNPQFNVDTSTSSVATGLNIKGAAAGGGVALTVLSSGTNEALSINAKGSGVLNLNTVASSGQINLSNSGTFVSGTTGAVVVKSIAQNAIGVGANGITNPVLKVDASATSVATGLAVTGAAAASGVALAALSSGTNENLTLSAKGSGTVAINSAVVATAGGAAASGVQYGSIGVGVYTGTGAPTFSAMNGSIYTDSNATTTTTRIYVNKSGAGTAGTTWTALTTAA